MPTKFGDGGGAGRGLGGEWAHSLVDCLLVIWPSTTHPFEREKGCRVFAKSHAVEAVRNIGFHLPNWTMVGVWMEGSRRRHVLRKFMP